MGHTFHSEWKPWDQGYEECRSSPQTAAHRGQPGHPQWFCMILCHYYNKRNPISLKTTISPSLSDSKGGLWWPGGSHQTPPSWFSTMVRFYSSEHEGICGKSWPAPYRKWQGQWNRLLPTVSTGYLTIRYTSLFFSLSCSPSLDVYLVPCM